MSDLDRLQDAFLKADELAQQGDQQAAQDARMFAQEIRRLQSAGVQQADESSFFGEQGGMAQLNRGIVETIGGVVDFLNPFDTPAVGEALGMPNLTTGSAQEGLARGFEAAGVNVADVAPEGIFQNIMRGVGQAAGAGPTAAGGARAVAAAPGIIGQAGQEAYRGLTTMRGLLAELVAGGTGAAASEAAEQAGAGPVLQNVAGLLGGIGGGAAIAAAPTVTPTAIGARAAGRAISRELAPFTERGARGVAQQRMQQLAGGPERAQELGLLITPESQIGLSPAQQTGDPNLLALERSAMREDPLIREAMDAQRAAAQERARELVAIGSRPEEAQQFLQLRQQQARESIQARIDRATSRANATRPIASIEPSEASNIVAAEIRRAEADALAQERNLWNQVPRGAQVNAQGSQNLVQNIVDETPWAQRTDIPAVARELLQQPRRQTVAEMHGLYSELRRIARTAMAGTDQNKNRARIANQIADSLLADMGAIDGSTEIGRTINTARAFSREMHELFDRGTVGRLLKRTVDGDEQVDPLLTLERSLGRGGTQALVGARDIRRAADTDAVDNATEQYLVNAFNERAFPSGAFSQAQAERFLEQNRELFNLSTRFQNLRARFEQAISQQQRATLARRRGEQFETGVSQSAAQRFIEAAPSQSMETIFRAARPAEMAESLLRQARRDKTGQAVEGFKASLSDYLIGRSSISTPDGPVLNSRRLQELLDSEDVQSVVDTVYTSSERSRLNAIAAELNRLEASSGAVDALADRPANSMLSTYARIVGARVGANLGGGFAGGLQSAGIVSSRAQQLIGRLTNDKAQQMLRDAVQDPELFRSLLMDVSIPENFDRVRRSLAPYIAGGVAAQTDSERNNENGLLSQ